MSDDKEYIEINFKMGDFSKPNANGLAYSKECIDKLKDQYFWGKPFKVEGELKESELIKQCINNAYKSLSNTIEPIIKTQLEILDDYTFNLVLENKTDLGDFAFLFNDKPKPEPITMPYYKNNVDKFMDYFTYHYDYPNPLSTSLENSLFEYVSSTYLNGLINYVDIKKGFVIHRYTAPSEEKLAALNEMYLMYHSNLYSCQDDVLLLCKIKESDDCYMLFWFDCDVSDCIVGKFYTKDSYELVLSKFLDYVYDRNIEMLNTYGADFLKVSPYEIDVTKLKGWKSF